MGLIAERPEAGEMPMLKTVPYTERPIRILFSRPPSIEDQGRAGHEAGRIRGEEDNHSPDFLRLSPAAH